MILASTSLPKHFLAVVELVKSVKSEVTKAEVENVLDGMYNNKRKLSDEDKRSQIIEGLMNTPLDAIEFGDNLVSVLASPLISKRASVPSEIGVPRYELFKKGNQNLSPEYQKTYDRMENIYTHDMADFAQAVLDNLNSTLPDDKKLFDGEEVTELPELSGQCEFKGWYTDPEFTGSFVPFTSGDKNHSKIYYANGNGSSSVSDNHIASDDELCSWVINDYENRTGKAHISAEITSKSGDSYEITLKDKAGNVVDVYKVDPVTGNSSNSADEQVELPQTGNNSMYNWMIVSGAFMLIICGCFAVKFSGFIRRKEDEEQTEI